MKKGLKSLLTLVLLVTILVPSTVIVLTGIAASSSKATEIKTDEVTTLGYARSSGLEVIINDCVKILQSIARLPETAETARRNYSAVSGEVDRIFANAVAAKDPHLLDIIVMNSEGTIYMDYSTKSPGVFFPGFSEVDNLAKNQTFKSNINENNGTFFVLTGITDGEELLGYIAMVFSTDIFLEYLINCYHDGNCREKNVFITDRKGTAVNFDGNSITRTSEISLPGVKEIINNAVGGVGAREFENVSSSSYIGAYGNIGGVANGWYWYSLFPVSDIDTFPATVRITVIIITAITLIFLLFMFNIVRKVTGPLGEIISKMRRINEGETHERIKVEGDGEYAYISETFNETMNEVLMSGELHRSISELADNMLFEWDFKKSTLYISDNFMNMFEIDPEKATLLNGRFIDYLMEKDDSERFKVDVNKMLRTGESLSGEYQVTTKFKSIIWVSIRAHCIKDRLDEILRVVGVITNINNEKTLSLQLAEKASYDFLSGLYNRATFMRELQNEITRHVGSRVALIFIDVDDFKNINDTYGHDIGDEIIKHVARVIKEKLKGVGFAGRFGGDEFVMCVTDELAIISIGRIAQETLDIFSLGYNYEEMGIVLPVKASLGIAIAPEHGKDNETLLAAADEAMYNVKKNGKHAYQIYNPIDNVMTNQLMN